MPKHVSAQKASATSPVGPSYSFSISAPVTSHTSVSDKKTLYVIPSDLIKTLLVMAILLAGQIILFVLLSRHIIHVNNVQF